MSIRNWVSSCIMRLRHLIVRLQIVVCNLSNWKIGLNHRRLMIICRLFQSPLLSWSNNARRSVMRGVYCLKRYGKRLLSWLMIWNSKLILMFRERKLELWMNIIGFISFIRRRLDRMRRGCNFKKYNWLSRMISSVKFKMIIRKWKINLRRIDINWMRWDE